MAFSLLLVAGVAAMPEQRWMQFVVPPLAMLRAHRTLGECRHFFRALPGMARDFLACRLLALFVIVVGWRVYRPGPVTRERIQGAVAVYLLLGLTWAHAYELLHILRPGAWTGTASEVPVSQTWIYYSFVTLTTMGHGEITPVDPVATFRSPSLNC